MSRFISAPKLLAGVLVASSLSVGCAQAQQPHMQAALVMLQNARAELAQAAPNKGGHREAGLALIDQAIAQVRAGIAFAAH